MSNKYMTLDKYRNRFVNVDDETSLNYFALFSAILGKDPSCDCRLFLPQELFDRDEAEKRMKEIDELRKNGEFTEAELIETKITRNKYHKDVLKEIEAVRRRRNFVIPVKVKNKYAGTEEVFSCVKEMCGEYGFQYKNIIEKFNEQKNKKNNKNNGKIIYKGLEIEKISRVK